jgi:hypothetical protein
MAAKLRANPEVKLAIVERQEEALEKAGMRHTRIAEEIAAVALASLEQTRDEKGVVRKFADLPAALLRGAQSIEFHPDGSIKQLRLAKTSGLQMAGQYLKLFVERHEHSGKDGAPIQTEEISEVSDLERARRIAHLLAQGLRVARAATVLSDTDESAGASKEPDGEG